MPVPLELVRLRLARLKLVGRRLSLVQLERARLGRAWLRLVGRGRSQLKRSACLERV